MTKAAAMLGWTHFLALVRKHGVWSAGSFLPHAKRTPCWAEDPAEYSGDGAVKIYVCMLQV